MSPRRLSSLSLSPSSVPPSLFHYLKATFSPCISKSSKGRVREREEGVRLVAHSAPCSVDAGGLQASLERPMGQRVDRRPNVRLRKCRWTVAYVRTLGSWVQAQARVARRRIGVALTRCRRVPFRFSPSVPVHQPQPPSTTMAAPRSIARKALASASAARSFSTVLAARPALVSAARAAAQGPKLTVRPQPSLPFPSPRLWGLCSASDLDFRDLLQGRSRPGC